MARRIPTFVVLLPLLAACATTAPETRVEVQGSDEVVYLEGVSSRYSVRLDDLRPAMKHRRNDRLPNAVVAGDQSVTVAASLFRHDDVYTLDLVLHNLGDEEIAIDRSRIELFDNDGDQLQPLLDWEPGQRFGLRAEQETFRGYHHLGKDFQQGQSGIASEKVAPPAERKQRTAGAVSGGDAAALTAAEAQPLDFSWLWELDLEKETVTLPAVVSILPGHDLPYWAYFRAHEVDFPLTAIVTVDGKRMLFRFDRPGHEAR